MALDNYIRIDSVRAHISVKCRGIVYTVVCHQIIFGFGVMMTKSIELP